MISVWVLARWLHLLAAITWIGGMLFILLVLLPVVRPALQADQRAMLVGKIGARYGVVSLIALGVLLVTGYVNGERREVDWADLTATDYGTRLSIKLMLVAMVVVITIIHTWYGRRIVAMAELPVDERSIPAAMAQRRRLHVVSGILSAVNLVMNLAVVWLAASLAA